MLYLIFLLWLFSVDLLKIDIIMEKSTKAIRRELAILIKQKIKLCTSKKEENLALETSRQEINLKYGKAWREWDDFELSY